jgi:SNF2 family DNA or RNA helicase
MSIRPPGWENNSQNKDISSKQHLASLRSNEPPIELPGEPSLPNEISFTMNDVKPIEDGHRKDLVRHASLQKPLLNGWKLFPHQKKSVLQGLIRRRMVLALDMGLGKTLIGCVWARSFKSTFDDLKVLIISPVSLKAEWKRTAEDATGLKVEDEKANGNDESLDLRICSWAKVPTKVAKCAKRYIVVFDEAHSMQSMTSSRTKDSLKLVLDDRYEDILIPSRLQKCDSFKSLFPHCRRCIGVLLLTGTPMKNGKPSNLFPLLRAVRHPLGKNQMAYEKHFCGGMLKSFGRGKPVWDANGCANLKQLKRLVSSNLLHLTKEQCLTLLPLTRHRYEVPISHRNQLQYIQAVKNLASLY